MEIVAVPPPARGRRPAALRPAVEPACRTQPGRSGLRVCRAFAVRRQRIGVAHAIRAIQVPDRLRFCGPAAKIRRAARNLGDPGFGSAVFLRSGGLKSACRFPAPALPDPRNSAAPTRSLGIRATVGASIYISPNYSRGLLNCRKYHGDGRLSVYPLVRNRHFPPEFATLSKKRRPMSPKRRVLPSKSWPLPPPPWKRQHYRGFEHLGRWGPRSGRPGHRPPGKLRYFLNGPGSFPGREAGSVCETHDSIGNRRHGWRQGR